MTERIPSLSIADRGFDSINVYINRATARARTLLIDLMHLAESDGKISDVPFIYTRRGPNCVHTDVEREKALVLGEGTDEYGRGHKVILKTDGAIISVALSDTKRVYSTETRREYERSYGHHSREVIRTIRSLKEIQYSGEKQETLEGVDYLKWSFVAKDLLEKSILGQTSSKDRSGNV